MDLYRGLTPAVLSYEGIAFQYMARAVVEDRQLAYVQKHLRILSAYYGVLEPMDGVTPYRLEMQAKVGIPENVELASEQIKYEALTSSISSQFSRMRCV